MLTAGALRVCWLLGLAFVRPGAAGLMLVMAVELGLITCVGVFDPVLATYRLNQVPTDRVSRTLSAWSVADKAAIAVLTVLWGLLATLTSARTAIAIAGVLILTTPPAPSTRPRAAARAGTSKNGRNRQQRHRRVHRHAARGDESTMEGIPGQSRRNERAGRRRGPTGQ
jgi:hypothetical protein